MPKAKPPAKTAPASAPIAEIEICDDSKPHAWPKPLSPLRGHALTYYYDLLQSAWAARGGLTPAEVKYCELAATAYADAVRWRKVADGLLRAATADGGDPNFTKLSLASTRAESASRAHSRAISLLGLEGRAFGAVRSKKLRAEIGTTPTGSKWGDLR
ncbi:hypothetical protein LCM28_09925 [Salipiger pacificus]|nr:hypothetical protein [Alloyangia pacifica]